MSKPRHKTQREYADEGKIKEAARYRLLHMARYDTDESQAAAFIKGLTGGKCGIPHAELLEDFIKENSLEGSLLRQALKAVQSPAP